MLRSKTLQCRFDRTACRTLQVTQAGVSDAFREIPGCYVCVSEACLGTCCTLTLLVSAMLSKCM